MNRCPKCQRQVPENARFCTSCGTLLTPAPEQQPLQPQYQPPAQQPVQSQYQPQQPVPPQYQPYVQPQPAPRKKKSPIALIIVAVVLAAALIGGGIWAVASGVFDGGSSVSVGDRDDDRDNGDDRDDGDGSGDVPAAEPDEVPAAPAEEVELTIWMSSIYSDSLEEMFYAFCDEYPDLNISVTYETYNESDAGTLAANDPGAAADIYVFPDDQLGILAEAGALASLDEYKEYVGDDLESSVDAATYAGSLYALPMTASNGYFMYYDSNFFSAEDVQSLEVMCQKAAAAGKKVVVPIENGWYLYSFFAGAGLEVTETSCDWDCDTGVAVCESILALVETGGMATYDGLGEAEAYGEDVAALVSGVWDAENMKARFGDGYACAKLPAFDLNGRRVQMGSFSGYKLIGINPNTDNLDVAVLFAEWLTNEDNQRIRFEENSDAPTNLKASAYAMAEATPELGALIAQSEYATVQRVGSSFWAPAEDLGGILAQGNPSNAPLDELLTEIVAAMGF